MSLLRTIISQQNPKVQTNFDPINWTAPTSGNYTILPNVIKRDIWIPSTSLVETYNHHPFAIEHNGEIHVMHSTDASEEEGVGMYIRYTKSSDKFETQEPYQVLFEPQDDVNEIRSNGGRVCIPSGFTIVEGELYALTDVNDRLSGSDPRPRVGVGVLARKINPNGTFDTPFWIENVDGSLTAPAPISGFPSYSFDSVMRQKIRNYWIYNVLEQPEWYLSTPDHDYLHTNYDLNGTDFLTEPRILKLLSNQFVKIWRYAGSVANYFKYVQFSDYGYNWTDPVISNIPDSPSRTAVVSTIDKKFILIGNADNGGIRSPLFFIISNDGLNYDANNIYTIDTETSAPDFSGFGKGVGVQYPHAIELSTGEIFVVYSVNKEGIRCSYFNKPNII